MAEDSEDKVLSENWPAPPPFFKHFTPANLERVHEARVAAGQDVDLSSPTTSPLDLSPDLRYLIPPLLPKNGQYGAFGESQDINGTPPNLSSRNIQQLYPTSVASSANNHLLGSPDSPIIHIIGLLRSLLLTFLSLTKTLSQDVSGAQEHLKNLHILSENIHQLLNELRPHQARQKLIEIMEERLEAGKKEIAEVKRLRDQVQVVTGKGIENGSETSITTVADVDQKEKGDRTESEQRRLQYERIWGALMELEV